MVSVEFTSLLNRFFPHLTSVEVEASSVHELVQQLDQQFSGLGGYLIEEHGGLRKHVNIFVNGKMIKDRKALSDPLSDNDKVNIIQALSGG